MTATPDHAEMCALANEYGVTLVYLQTTLRGTVAFMVNPASVPGTVAPEDVVPLDGVGREDLDRLLLDRPSPIRLGLERLTAVPDDWKNGEPGWVMSYWLRQFASGPEAESAAEALWMRTMERVLQRLGRVFQPVFDRLRASHASFVVLLTADRLGLLPIHALPSTDDPNGQTFGEEFEIAYAPSSLALRRCLERASGSEPEKLATFAALANPDGTLDFADIEVDMIARRFGDRAHVAHGNESTRAWILAAAASADYLQLSTHARFAHGNPASSAILLAPEPANETSLLEGEADELDTEPAQPESLRLGDIWGGFLRLREGSVVIASACETSQVDALARNEESLGFPAALLGAGAATVIASLWSVDDLSTPWLMDRTYELMLSEARLRPSAALNQASAELRRLTRSHAIAWLESVLAPLEQEYASRVWRNLPNPEYGSRLARLRTLREYRSILRLGPEIPFSHPVHWAAFVAYGS
jgi:CHAT domain-containing protein